MNGRGQGAGERGRESGSVSGSIPIPIPIATPTPGKGQVKTRGCGCRKSGTRIRKSAPHKDLRSHFPFFVQQLALIQRAGGRGSHALLRPA